jgi:hypothetical protein
MCEYGKTRRVLVKIPEDLSCTGFSKFQYEDIDSCISPIVEALQKGAIDMRGSCCGHNKTFGDIHLQDGRVLIIVDDKFYFNDKYRKRLNKLYIDYLRDKNEN